MEDATNSNNKQDWTGCSVSRLRNANVNANTTSTADAKEPPKKQADQ